MRGKAWLDNHEDEVRVTLAENLAPYPKAVVVKIQDTVGSERSALASLSPSVAREVATYLIELADKLDPPELRVDAHEVGSRDLPRVLLDQLEGHSWYIVRISGANHIDIDTSTSLKQTGLGVSGQVPIEHVSNDALYLAYRIPVYQGANPIASLTRNVARNLDPLKQVTYDDYIFHA